MILQTGFLIVATRLQEAAMSHSDVHARLRDAITSHPKNKDRWASLVDVFGDDKSGDAVYSSGDGLKKASYTMGASNGKTTCDVDCDNATDVMPRTSYEEQPDDQDMYASMESAKLYQPGTARLCERFIPKSERDAADSGSFAGKGKSFPILSPGDVSAAVHAMGRAGADNYDAGTLKRNIIRIAKAKGWTSSLPKAWQDGGDEKDSKESAAVTSGALKLFESANTTEVIVIREAKADYEIKLIAPGKGSTAFYPKEVLQRDGPQVFKAGTHVYLNHATAAEEAQRPEGDVKNLAGVLTGAAYWQESHTKGPGLYGRMKVFQDHAQMVEEKAAHVGMSIRASGTGTGRLIDGKPELASLTNAESVDVVTRAGAGGMILTESARTQEGELNAQEIQRIVESATAPLRERLIRTDAREAAAALLQGVTLPEPAKLKIIEVAVREAPVTGGVLDQTKLGEIVAREAKSMGEFLASVMGSGRVTGMGIAPVQIDAKEAERRELAQKREDEQTLSVFESLIGGTAAKFAAQGRAN